MTPDVHRIYGYTIYSLQAHRFIRIIHVYGILVENTEYRNDNLIYENSNMSVKMADNASGLAAVASSNAGA